MDVPNLLRRIEYLEKIINSLYLKLDDKVTEKVCQVCGEIKDTTRCVLCAKRRCSSCKFIFISDWELERYELCSPLCTANAERLEKMGPLSRHLNSNRCTDALGARLNLNR